MAEDTRVALLAAAREQFGEHGYHGATLDAIADAAGFSKGVVYSRFDSKDDLFLAVLADHIEQRRVVIEQRFSELSGPRDIAVLAQWALRSSLDTVAWQVALLEFRAHAWRHPAVNARYVELHNRTLEVLIELFGELYRRAGRDAPIPKLSALAALAAGTGVVTEYMADPDLDASALMALLVGRLSETEPTDDPTTERPTEEELTP